MTQYAGLATARKTAERMHGVLLQILWISLKAEEFSQLKSALPICVDGSSDL